MHPLESIKLIAKYGLIFFLTIGFISIEGCGSEELDRIEQKDSKPIQSINKLDSLLDEALALKEQGRNGEALVVIDSLYADAQLLNDLTYLSCAEFEKGMNLFILNEVDSSLIHWLNALYLSKQLDDEPNMAQLLSNIGIVYFDKGYYRSASEYFIQARNKMEEVGDSLTESYAFTTINLAVVHINQEEFDLARKTLSSVKIGAWPTVDFLYYLNSGIVEAETGNYDQFLDLIDSSKSFKDEVNPYYLKVLEGVLWDKALKKKDLLKLRELLNKTKVESNQNDIDQTISWLYGNLILDSTYTVPSNLIDSLIITCSEEGLIISRLSLYSFLKEYYKIKENFTRYVFATEKYDFWKKESSRMNATSNLIDYYLVLELDKSKFENEQLKSKNQISDLKIKNQLYLNYFLIFMVSTIILISYLIYLKLQKEKKESEQKLSKLSENIEVYKETEKDLKETIDFQNQRINEVMENVSKIAILRKQLDDFFNKLTDSVELEVSPKSLKSAKIDLEAFFNNYTDLAIIATKGQDTINFEQPLFATLTAKEKKVLEFIAAKYTSREIGVLLSRSEKSVEYTRKNIRRKLNIPLEMGIDIFLKNNV